MNENLCKTNPGNKVIDVSKKTFISVICILAALIILTIILTYIIPKGEFRVSDTGEILYGEYIQFKDAKGINIFKGIFSPILVMFSDGGISVIILSIFLLIISGTFQVMNDVNGMRIIVQKLIKKYEKKKSLLIAFIVLVFMCFGAFFGLFEETITLLPIIILLALSLGFDSFTGFLMCTVATGLGFASAITNPFSVLLASQIINVSPMSTLWYRIIIFIIMYLLLLGYIKLHIKRITKDPEKSPTYDHDVKKKALLEEYTYEDNEVTRKTFLSYTIFLLCTLALIIIVTSIPALRDYTVIFLIVIFLFGGMIAGYISTHNMKRITKSFLNGVVSALPTIVMVLMASSIKYILEEGMILDTITNSITIFIQDKNIYLVALILLGIILVLEFMISSSTAKAIFVMSVLGGVTLGISKELLVLIYVLGDGYTNILYPTSPVLLIALSMTGLSYTKWLKKSKWFFALIFALVVIFVLLGVLIKL